MSSPRFVILRGFQTSSRREKERERLVVSHTKKIPQLSRSHIITRKTSSFARTSPGPRSIVRPRDRDQAETASRRERKKERKKELSLVDFPTTSSLTKKHPSKERDIFPSSSSSSPIPISHHRYKRTTKHIGVHKKQVLWSSSFTSSKSYLSKPTPSLG